MMRLVPALLLLVAGCTGVEADIKRAEMGQFFENFIRGKDRGVNAYSRKIDQSITKVQGGRYQYVEPAYLSSFYVDWAVRGLGGTKLPNSDYLAAVADKLLFVMSYDPTSNVRSTACDQLGRLLLPLPPGPLPPSVDSKADARINQVADDLLKQATDAKEGKRVPIAAVLERMHALEAERPTSLLSARQMVRVLAAPPIVSSPPGAVRDLAEEIGPSIVRDSILVALRDVSVGLKETEPDESPLVRHGAIRVLTRVASPVAREGAIARLSGQLDPLERDPDVRCALVAYLGSVGGPGAFAACVERLDDVDLGVRLYAQASLQQLTGARAEPTAEAWRAVAEKEPALAKGPGG